MFLRVITVVSIACCITTILHTTYVTLLQYESRRQHHDNKDDIIAYDIHHQPIYRRECMLKGKLEGDGNVPFLLIAIPTLYREYKGKTAFYLHDTLRSLIEPLTTRQKQKVKIVVMLTDREYAKRNTVYHRVLESAHQYLASGLIEIAAPPSRYYRDLSNVGVDQKQGDGKSRVQWRSQQSLDYSFILGYARNYCKYFLMVEDDVTASRNYYDVIERDVTEKNIPLHVKPRWLSYFDVKTFDVADDTTLKSDGGVVPWPVDHNLTWLSMSYYGMGYIGVLYPSHVLPLISFLHKEFYFGFAVDLMHQSLSYYNFRQYQREYLFVHRGNQSSSLGTF